MIKDSIVALNPVTLPTYSLTFINSFKQQEKVAASYLMGWVLQHQPLLLVKHPFFEVHSFSAEQSGVVPVSISKSWSVLFDEKLST